MEVLNEFLKVPPPDLSFQIKRLPIRRMLAEIRKDSSQEWCMFGSSKKELDQSYGINVWQGSFFYSVIWVPYIRKGSHLEIDSLDELMNLRVAYLGGVVLKGTYLDKIKALKVNNSSQLESLLKTGRVDIIIHIYPSNSSLVDIAEPMLKFQLRRGDQSLNCNSEKLASQILPWYEARLDELKKNGSLKRLIESRFKVNYDDYMKSIEVE